MVLSDFDQYSRISLDGDDYTVVVELPMGKMLCARVADVGGGASAAPLYLMERPA